MINDAMDILTENYYNFKHSTYMKTDLQVISGYKEVLHEIKLQARQCTLDAFFKLTVTLKMSKSMSMLMV
jgi:hypothetical protein